MSCCQNHLNRPELDETSRLSGGKGFVDPFLFDYCIELALQTGTVP